MNAMLLDIFFIRMSNLLQITNLRYLGAQVFGPVYDVIKIYNIYNTYRI